MRDLSAKVGTPSAEIIVYVNDRDAGFLRALFQPQNFSRHWPGVAEKLVRLGKIEIVDDVDEEQRHFRFIRRAAVQIWISCRHGNETGRLCGRPLALANKRSALFLSAGFLSALLPAFARRGFAALLPAARSAFLSALVGLVHGRPSAFL